MTTPDLKRILLVEDEPDIQEVARLAMEAVGGFSVEICSSGSEALKKAPVFAPDLIILDVMMPEMDGPDTLRALREVPGTASIPVIFMTAKAQPQELRRYKEMGILDVVSKPFDPMTLSTTISDIWRHYHASS